MTVSDGGKVYCTVGNVGDYNHSNRVVVSGANAEWNCSSTFTLGGAHSGSYNELVVTNGGRFFVSVASFVAVGNAAGCARNRVTVTGSGSRWDAPGSTIRVGSSGPSNEMWIADGALVGSGQLCHIVSLPT